MANKFLVTAIFCFILSFMCCHVISSFASSQFPWMFLAVLAVVPAVISCILGTIYLYLASQKISKYHTVRSALLHFCISYFPLVIARRRIKFIRLCCQKPREAQEKCLKRIISCNKNTDYGAKLNLSEITCIRDLQAKHPLTSYDDYKQYIDRIANGEENVLTGEKVTRLVLSSGTTGDSKLIPMNMGRYLTSIMTLLAIVYETFPENHVMQKNLRLHCNSEIRKSNCGLTIAGTMVLEENQAQYLMIYSTPPDGFMINDKEVAFYVHFLFGLRERDLGFAGALFGSMFLEGFKYLEKHWPRIVKDLANGTLNTDLNIPGLIRKSLTEALGHGDPERAEEVKREFEKGQQGIIKRLWPQMKGVVTIDNTGIRETIMNTIAEGLLMYSPLYPSSEGIIGVNFNPFQRGQEEFLLSITDLVYELIAEEDIGKSNPKTFLIDEVEVGRNYELVFTQIWGLYRYRLGDVVQVSGFYKNCPTIKFMYRTGTILSLIGEKVDQVTLANALTSALSQWTDVRALLHYCVAESTLLSGLSTNYNVTEESSHYVIFMELDSSDEHKPDSSPIDLSKLAQQIDENIYSHHAFYRNFKDSGFISTSRVYLVQSGTFGKLKAHILANSAATEIQFKMPKKIRTRGMAEVMLENIQT